MKNYLPYLSAFALSAVTSLGVIYSVNMPATHAADHFDGPQVKAEANKSGDIADLYVFREGDQTGNEADNDKLVFVLTALDKLSADVQYDIKVSRSKDNINADKTMSFRVANKDESGVWDVFLNGDYIGKTGQTNMYKAGGEHDAKIYVGEKDDPFFIDLRVVQEGPATGKDDPADSIAGGNVNAFVISVPVAYFQTDAKETSFYSWAVTSK